MESYLMKNSTRGKAHKKRGKKNEDYIIAKRIDVDKILIIAADGVSACLYGGRASKLVVKCFYAFVRDELKKCKNEEEIRNAFLNASDKTLICLKEVATRKGGIREWGTTLEVGFYCNGEVYYLHCGDGAIFSITKDGFVNFTTNELHKGEGMKSVVPFSERNSWELGKFTDKSIGMVVMTDGVYELIRPIGIRNYGYEYEPAIFIPVIDRRCHLNLKNNHYTYVNKLFNGVIKDEEAIDKLKIIQKESNRELIEDYEVDYKMLQDSKLVTRYESMINDDMTIGIFISGYPKEYKDIREPDYKWIIEEDFKRAYPQYF